MKKTATITAPAARTTRPEQNVSKHLGALHAEGFVSRRTRDQLDLPNRRPRRAPVCDGISAGIEAQLAEMEAALSGLSLVRCVKLAIFD